MLWAPTSLLLLQESWDQLLASSKYNEQESFVVVFQPAFYETLPSVSEGCREEPGPSLPLATLICTEAPALLGFPKPSICGVRGEGLRDSLILSLQRPPRAWVAP